MNFIRWKFLRLLEATKNRCVLIDALHASPESHKREFYTDEIAEQVAEETGCHCIIAERPREEMDLNQFPREKSWPAHKQYRDTIHYLLDKENLLNSDGRVKFPFLHLSLHGMMNDHSKDVELGTNFGNSCSRDILDWTFGRFQNWADSFPVDNPKPVIMANDENEALYGHPVIAVHRQKYGHNYNAIQVELAHWIRENHRDSLVELLKRMVREFSQVRLFVYGTLMRGERNHHMLGESPFLGEHRTANGFALRDLGGFPAMVRDGGGYVAGEVYLVDPETIRDIDALEGHPDWYERSSIRADDGSSVQAYLLTAKQVQGRRLIVSGDWRKRTEKIFGV